MLRCHSVLVAQGRLICSYEERKRSLDTVATRHKESSTFEDFMARVYNPLPATNTITTSASSLLATAIIDNSYRATSKSMNEFRTFRPNAELTIRIFRMESLASRLEAVSPRHSAPNDSRCEHRSSIAPAQPQTASVQKRTEEA